MARLPDQQLVDQELSAADAFALTKVCSVGGLLGESVEMQRLFEQLARAATMRVDVLMIGEPGSGKELAARCLHELSARSAEPFLVLNCGAPAAGRIEAELFGCDAGAASEDGVAHFTSERGHLERAGRGTVLLEEIGELPPEMQLRLLRALESRRIVPVGGSREIEIHCRVVATIQPDSKASRSASVLPDLLDRLSVCPVIVPALRDRRGDAELLARYFLAESVLLGVVGGALGLALAWAGVHLLVAFGPVNLPRLNEVRIDAVVVVFTAGLSLIAAFAFGAIPLLRLAPLTTTLHDSGRGQTATRAQHRARHALMTSQVALALVLLVASGLMVRSVQQLRNMDLGFNPASTLTFGLALPDRAYATRERAARAHRAILERLNALPGVTSASASSGLPLSGGNFGNGLVVENELDNPQQLRRQFAWFRAVAGGYLETAGIRLIRGRTITRDDVDRREPVVVIDETGSAIVAPLDGVHGDPRDHDPGTSWHFQSTKRAIPALTGKRGLSLF